RHTRYWRDWSSDVCSSDLSLRFGGPFPLRHRAPELGARADAELAIHAREVSLDGLRAEVDPLGDRAVRETRRGQRGDRLLGRAEVARRAPHRYSCQLGPGKLGPERRAQALECLQRLHERGPPLAPLLAPPLQTAELEQRPSPLERHL